MLEYFNSSGYRSRKDKQQWIVEMADREFSVVEYVPISEPDEPDATRRWASIMMWAKDGRDALLEYPDPEQIRDLFCAGYLSWRIVPHHRSRSFKLRVWKTASC